MTGRDGMRAIANVVSMTGIFETVRLATRVPDNVEAYPLCWVEPTAIGDSHHRLADHPHSPDRLTPVHFALHVYAGKGGDELDRADWMASACEALIGAIRGHGLGGAVCALTQIESAKIGAAKHGEDALLVGSFTMIAVEGEG